jgi:hypothetical protein
LVQRAGFYKPFIVGGFVIMITGFVLMTRISPSSAVFDVAWRVFLLGVGIGPALPLLNLAMQNAAQPHQVGAVTANRQFFQQMGQALGGAIFGLILSATLTAQLEQNFTPIIQSLPVEAQAVLDPEQFRSSSGVGENAGGEAQAQVDLGTQIAAATIAPIEQQRTLAEAALGNGDQAARTELLNSPTTLPAIKAQVADSMGSDPAALARVNSVIDAAEQEAAQEAQLVGQQVIDAVKQAYATSITRIYVYGVLLATLALAIIAIWLPEIPLARTNRVEAPIAVE